jgi:tRNA pseudouridine38-40 synthase
LPLKVRYVLEIAYDGTEYHGWQSQLNGTTVQEALELQLAKILGAKINIMGCGRTDAGVHASHFILHFDYDNDLPDRFKFRINRMLPSDIAVYEAFEVTDNFHSRFSATYRKYIYKTHFRKNPFQEGGSLFLFQMPSVDKMNEACKLLLRQDDFASFCKRNADGKTTICDLMLAEWVEVEYGFEFHVKANRFLRNMVRALVGTLLDVGYGTLSLEQLEQIIKDKKRSSSGKSVAARGLYLEEIGYNWDEYRK